MLVGHHLPYLDHINDADNPAAPDDIIQTVAVSISQRVIPRCL